MRCQELARFFAFSNFNLAPLSVCSMGIKCYQGTGPATEAMKTDCGAGYDACISVKHSMKLRNITSRQSLIAIHFVYRDQLRNVLPRLPPEVRDRRGRGGCRGRRLRGTHDVRNRLLQPRRHRWGGQAGRRGTRRRDRHLRSALKALPPGSGVHSLR